jgi:hypothetical protein
MDTMKTRFFSWAVVATMIIARALAQEPVELPAFQVSSPRVALEDPVASFSMPVTALRYEPLLDVEARNQAEGQADVAIRGGIFENTGFRIGGAFLFDPQTGHYFAELPVAPAMISGPRILTGAENALGGFNADVGTVAYDWQAIRPRGELTVTAGQYGSYDGSIYQGIVSNTPVAGRVLAADAEVAVSSSDGSVPYGDHHYQRYDGRIQLAGNGSQTDLFYGYQAKFIGWPNLYTPFNSDETDDLETAVVMLNHRINWGPDDKLEAAVFWRRNKDDYAFNRFAPVGAVHPFQTTTWMDGVSVSGREDLGVIGIGYDAAVLTDDIKSTSLAFGPFHSRTYTKIGVDPEKIWTLPDGQRLTIKTGVTLDDTNREGSTVSPLAEIALDNPASANGSSRLYLDYADSSQVPTYTALDSSPTAGLFRGNPDLGRTYSHDLELGLDATQAGWQEHLAVFYRRDDHLVDWTFQNGVFARIANPVDIDTAGVEGTLRWSAQSFDVIIGYTHLEKRADYGATIVDGSFYALNFPRDRLTLAIVGRLGRGFELRMDNQARIQEPDPLRTEGGNHAVISSLGLFYRPPIWRSVDLHVQVDNLWNSAFQQVPAVPAARREISAGVTYCW